MVHFGHEPNARWLERVLHRESHRQYEQSSCVRGTGLSKLGIICNWTQHQRLPHVQILRVYRPRAHCGRRVGGHYMAFLLQPSKPIHLQLLRIGKGFLCCRNIKTGFRKNVWGHITREDILWEFEVLIVWYGGIWMYHAFGDGIMYANWEKFFEWNIFWDFEVFNAKIVKNRQKRWKQIKNRQNFI